MLCCRRIFWRCCMSRSRCCISCKRFCSLSCCSCALFSTLLMRNACSTSFWTYAGSRRASSAPARLIACSVSAVQSTSKVSSSKLPLSFFSGRGRVQILLSLFAHHGYGRRSAGVAPQSMREVRRVVHRLIVDLDDHVSSAEPGLLAAAAFFHRAHQHAFAVLYPKELSQLRRRCSRPSGRCAPTE